MSVSREVIAEANGVEPQEVMCCKCAYGEPFFAGTRIRCQLRLWGRMTAREENFCSLWERRSDE